MNQKTRTRSSLTRIVHGSLRRGRRAMDRALGSRREPLPDPPVVTKADRENLARAEALRRVDLREHNSAGRPPRFADLVSQAVSADQFDEPDYVRWAELLGFAEKGRLVVRGSIPTVFNRKVWEWAFVLRAAEQYGLLEPGRTAIGFGVGNEPVPAALARYGMKVVATDQDAEDSEDWAATGQWTSTGQLLTGLEGLSRPEIVPNDRLGELVTVRRVDMTDVPDDLGPCDLVWSSCALEHLGSPPKGLEFVVRSARLLAPGGVAAHTTEFELTARSATADWGHLACYRPADLRELSERLRSQGLEIELNLHVPMDRAEDRWVSVVLGQGPELEAGELSHLKVAVHESVCTSFGIVVHRPEPVGYVDHV
jgi:Methyltransferase domain